MSLSIKSTNDDHSNKNNNSNSFSPFWSAIEESNENEKRVLIQLFGDSGVGKTSLLLSLICEQFYDYFSTTNLDNSERTLIEDVYVPIDANDCYCLIRDSQVSSFDLQCISNYICDANVICLVFDQNWENHSIEQWLTSFDQCFNELNPTRRKPPVILVANKCDIDYKFDENILDDLMIKYEWLAYFIYCSAASLYNIPEVFAYALKCSQANHDLFLDLVTVDLRSDVVDAFNHVFRILDVQQNNRIGNAMLCLLEQIIANQNECNNCCKLLNKHLAKLLCKIEHPSVDETCRESDLALNQTEFLFLCELLLMDRNANETLLSILSSVGYNHNLAFVSKAKLKLQLSLERIESQPVKYSVELSESGEMFLRQFYQTHLNNMRNSLSRPTVKSIYQLLIGYRLEISIDSIGEMLENILFFEDDSYSNVVGNDSNVSMTNQDLNEFHLDDDNVIQEDNFVFWFAAKMHQSPERVVVWLAKMGFEFYEKLRNRQKNKHFASLSSKTNLFEDSNCYSIKQFNSNQNLNSTISCFKRFNNIITCWIYSKPISIAKRFLNLISKTNNDWLLINFKCCSINVIFKLYDDNNNDMAFKDITNEMVICVCDYNHKDSITQAFKACDMLKTSKNNNGLKRTNQIKCCSEDDIFMSLDETRNCIMQPMWTFLFLFARSDEAERNSNSLAKQLALKQSIYSDISMLTIDDGGKDNCQSIIIGHIHKQLKTIKCFHQQIIGKRQANESNLKNMFIIKWFCNILTNKINFRPNLRTLALNFYDQCLIQINNSVEPVCSLINQTFNYPILNELRICLTNGFLIGSSAVLFGLVALFIVRSSDVKEVADLKVSSRTTNSFSIYNIAKTFLR